MAIAPVQKELAGASGGKRRRPFSIQPDWGMTSRMLTRFKDGSGARGRRNR